MIWPVVIEQQNGRWIARCQATTPICHHEHLLARTVTRQPAEKAADMHLKHLNEIRNLLEGLRHL